MPSRYTNTWVENTPTPTDNAGYIYQYMQRLRVDFRERMQAPEWSVGYRLKDLGTVSAGTVTLDLNEGDCFRCVLPTSGTVTFDLSNFPNNAYDEKVLPFITIIIRMPSSGTPTVAWSSKFKVAVPFSLITANNTYSILQAMMYDTTASNVILMPLVTGVAV